MKFSLATTAAGLKAGIRAAWATWNPGAAGRLAGEQGGRVASDTAMERLYRNMWLDTERRALIREIRHMDLTDGRVKQVHRRVARDCIRGGLVMQIREKHSSETLKREWNALVGRLQLDNAEKLKSDSLGLSMEGNLPLQLVYDDTLRLVSSLRMPSDTIVPMTDMGGRFKDPGRAYEQRDVMTGEVIGAWAAWQMALARLDAWNFDDMGAMGRPLLDSCAQTWRKLVMTEEDLVLRRRMRAPLRLSHVLEGASGEDLKKYEDDHYARQDQLRTDFFSNKKGSVTAVQGDSTLGDIQDVVHLMDTFFAGGPAPKALFGYTEGLSRDILEDIKRDYYDEVDGLQDCHAYAYNMAFRMHLLFRGIDPAHDEFELRFAQRRTDTPNQVADLALKEVALGLPDDVVYARMGLDPDYIREKRIEQAQRNDPYPPLQGAAGGGEPAKVSVTPGNARKGESGTTINNPGGNGGRGRA